MARPTISIIMATFNRAHTLPRAIDSVLAQDMPDWELIIVDDGSADSTQELLKKYSDPRISVVSFEYNRGVAAAKNAGFDNMRGEWFTTLDSDDEMTPNALSVMLDVLNTVSPDIDAVTCNCLDTTTGQFSGKGLDADGWLDYETMNRLCSGENWGITKTSLLGNLRFNENLRGGEGVLWSKINRRAKRYYVHRALRIYHTEGDDRICRQFTTQDLSRRVHFYCAMSEEMEYLQDMRRFRPSDYASTAVAITVSWIIAGDRSKASNALRDAGNAIPHLKRLALRILIILGPTAARAIAIRRAK